MIFALRHWLSVFAVVVALCFPLAAQSQTPQQTGRVTDRAEVLTAEDKQLLTQMLADYENETTHQIAVVTVPTLSGESIEVVSLRIAKAWALGRKGVDNGILVVLAPAEHRVRIELGLGFERYISNAQAGEIIQTKMLPAFRENEYFRGLKRGLRELMRLGRAFVAPRSSSSNGSGG
jgi:uncharacterized protein